MDSDTIYMVKSVDEKTNNTVLMGIFWEMGEAEKCRDFHNQSDGMNCWIYEEQPSWQFVKP